MATRWMSAKGRRDAARDDDPAFERIGLSRTEAAEYVGISASLFDQLVADGRMPRPKQVGARVIYYRLAVKRAFVELPDASSLPHHEKGTVDPYVDTAA